MNAIDKLQQLSRRDFFTRGRNLLGGAALTSLLGNSLIDSASASPAASLQGGLGYKTHFPPTAKRVIYLHMVGGPSQLDLFDYKPGMADWYDKDLPESIRKGQRLTTVSYTHLRAHETKANLVCRLLLEKKKK